ncbi:MAG: SBBP repeat-containing protein [Actinomycetota bacterium]
MKVDVKRARRSALRRLLAGVAVAALLMAGSSTPHRGTESGPYDPAVALTTTEPELVFSSYLGGSDLDEGLGVAIDGDGNMYLTGSTKSVNFPASSGAVQETYAGSEDAFVAKVNADYTLAWATYLGGAGKEVPRSIDVDDAGNVYVTGSTASMDFPTTPNVYQEQSAGKQDIYLTKLTSSGGLVFSTYLGGDRDEGRPNVEVDSLGTIHLSGFTTSKDFPLVNALQPAPGGQHDSFVTRMEPDGTDLIFSTYLGGEKHDTPRCVATDADGNTYVHGWTMSTSFPTTAGAYQTTHGGGLTDVFVTKIDNQSPPQYAYSTYLGGSDEDWTYNGDCMDVDSSGSAYVTGYTVSLDWPTVNAFQGTYGGGAKDSYVAKLQSDGSGLVYSTYLGGEADDEGFAIAVDSSGYAHATGMTKSSAFPIVNAPTQKPGGFDAYVTKFEPSGSGAAYSMFVGGKRADRGRGVAVDLAGNAYLVGSTGSANFPTINAFQATGSGKQEAFIAKIASSTEDEPPPQSPSDDTTPPTVIMHKPSPEQLLVTMDVRVTWLGEDDVGISRYDLYERIGTTGSQMLVQSSNSTKYRRSGDPGKTYCYQVYAYDTSGNEGVGEEHCAAVPYDDTGSAITYTDGVNALSTAGAYQDTLTVLDGEGQEAEASFNGRKVGLLVQKNPSSGQADVYLDGVFERNIDLYSTRINNKVYVFSTTFTSGPRSIRVVWAGEKSSSSSGTAISLDGLAVISE